MKSTTLANVFQTRIPLEHRPQNINNVMCHPPAQSVLINTQLNEAKKVILLPHF